MKSQNSPTISIVMPVFNTADFLPAALLSLQKQTFSDWELIIVDDHSTDESWKIAQQYAQNDARIRVQRNKTNHGVAYSANIALKMATGQYVARMDSDDIAMPKRLAIQLKYLQQNPKVIAVGGQCDVINTHGQIIGQKHFPTNPEKVSKMLLSFASIQQPTMMVNTALLPKNFQWYKNDMTTAEEHELLFRMLQHGQLANVKATVLKYRMHSNNISTQHPKRDFWRIAEARWNGVTKYNYTPNLKGVLTTLVQAMLVISLPESLLYKLYSALRGWSAPVQSNSMHNKTQTFKKLASLSLFFPLHNEEANVNTVTKQAITIAEQVAEKYEIILINDGSTDSTKEKAEKLAKKHPAVKLINQKNLGYGGALQRGFKEAKYEWVFFSDGDLQFDLSELKKLIPATETNQVVLGYRKKRADHWKRTLLAKLLKIWNIIFFQFPVGIKDIDCAFKLIHKSVVTSVFPLQSNGAMISSELLLKIFDEGFTYTQIGVTHLPRKNGEQTGANLNVIAGAIKDTAVLYWHRNLQPLTLRVKNVFNSFTFE